MRTILAIMASLGLTLTAAAIQAAGPDGSFQGEWRTTLSTVKLEQKGNEVTGTYGNDKQFPLKGTAKDNVLTFEFTEGQVKGDGRYELDDIGQRVQGHVSSSQRPARRVERLAAGPESHNRQASVFRRALADRFRPDGIDPGWRRGQGQSTPSAARPISRARPPAGGSNSSSRASGTATAGLTSRPTEKP